MDNTRTDLDKVPYRIIEPSTRFRPFVEIRDIWHHRELMYLLTWRDYKIRYKQTLIGIAWAICQPILATIAFVVVFGRFGDITDNAIPYILFVYSGMIIWQYFANSVTESSGSLVASRQMITKIYFPRIIIPLAKISTQLIDLVPSSIILLILMIYFGTIPSISGIALVIPIIISLTLTSAGVGVILSAINVKYRDVQFIVPYFVQLGLFLSPVIYSSVTLGKYHRLLLINPVSGVIDSFRAAIFGTVFPIQSFAISCAIALILGIVGLYYFVKSESAFSDII